MVSTSMVRVDISGRRKNNSQLLVASKKRFSLSVGEDWSEDQAMPMMEPVNGLPTVMIRVRMSAHDAHYGGNLVDGAKMLQLFGDVGTELSIRLDGDEGLFRAYDNIEFLAPVHAGDFIEAHGRVVQVGRTSRKLEFEAWKVICPRPDISDSAAEVLPEPVLVCKASGTGVTLLERQRSKKT
jgi:3-aminobutyryl-CoA ammonia-lyase